MHGLKQASRTPFQQGIVGSFQLSSQLGFHKHRSLGDLHGDFAGDGILQDNAVSNVWSTTLDQ